MQRERPLSFAACQLGWAGYYAQCSGFPTYLIFIINLSGAYCYWVHFIDGEAETHVNLLVQTHTSNKRHGWNGTRHSGSRTSGSRWFLAIKSKQLSTLATSSKVSVFPKGPGLPGREDLGVECIETRLELINSNEYFFTEPRRCGIGDFLQRCCSNWEYLGR